MSRSTLAAIPARRTAALLATATTTFGLLTLASPAHADSVVQLSGPAGPVPANTAYTVTIDVPNTGSGSRSTGVNVKLSGAAATVTSATASSQMWYCDFSAGSTGSCRNLANLPDPTSITLTVLPTAGGTVTTDVDARDFADRPVGSATLDTQVAAPAPTVAGLEPGHGPLAGGTAVTITGAHFTGATGVSFGATPATAFSVDSDSRITATVPAGAAPGPVAVAVTTPGGTSATGRYTYDAPPVGTYTLTESSDPKSGSVVHTGDKVTYTVTVVQHGDGGVQEARVRDDLSEVLDDADYNGDVRTDLGAVEVQGGRLLWTGDLPVGGSATITYSVTVNGKGDHRLSTSAEAPDDPRGDCGTGTGCATDLTVKDAVTPSPTPTPTPTDGSQTPGTPSPDPSTPSAPATSPAPQTPAASGTPQASGVLASTGADVLTTAATGGALLLLGGLTVALGRRRGRHG
ncbi:DUF7927 domain-containing protein [Kitasatospora griseola]|uniref:DUF7927 domain-containing protein n=1 Tax=Kitasatospora griseola TaxID=2064 RepID=UPI0019A18956|nr:IPT/TIG domain-containing protein [Kitasatospora griseola]GGQ59559.1 hypothetical protein GCM10010195_13990 [Kitasatospora griseola]